MSPRAIGSNVVFLRGCHVTSGLGGWALQGQCWLSSHIDVPDPTRPPLNRKLLGGFFLSTWVPSTFLEFPVAESFRLFSP